MFCVTDDLCVGFLRVSLLLHSSSLISVGLLVDLGACWLLRCVMFVFCVIGRCCS